MIDTNELRRLAQAAIAKMSASDPEFASSTPPLAILELLGRLEAAEKERDALRAKIARMERQEPVAWARKLAMGLPSFGCVTDLKYRPSNMPESAYMPLYALPGAQPAPSVPDGFAWPECPKRRQSHVLFDDGYEEGWAACVATIKAALAAPEAKP